MYSGRFQVWSLLTSSVTSTSLAAVPPPVPPLGAAPPPVPPAPAIGVGVGVVGVCSASSHPPATEAASAGNRTAIIRLVALFLRFILSPLFVPHLPLVPLSTR